MIKRLLTKIDKTISTVIIAIALGFFIVGVVNFSSEALQKGEQAIMRIEYVYAFAESSDGTILQNESCRKNLTDVIFSSTVKIKRIDQSNVFYVEAREPYYIHAFRTFSECDTALTNIVIRKKINKK
ncbi:MAG: hypothetical protein NDI63_08910 [Pseudobdellovibrio sp.]|nr:hypothetical protein [Pseudobdellovibrio sp.]